jgi:hypothetical protein
VSSGSSSWITVSLRLIGQHRLSERELKISRSGEVLESMGIVFDDEKPYFPSRCEFSPSASQGLTSRSPIVALWFCFFFLFCRCLLVFLFSFFSQSLLLSISISCWCILSLSIVSRNVVRIDSNIPSQCCRDRGQISPVLMTGLSRPRGTNQGSVSKLEQSQSDLILLKRPAVGAPLNQRSRSR